MSLEMLENRIFITGASSGIGRALAIKLSKLGANVLISGRNIQELELTLEQCSGQENDLLPLDLKDHEKLPKILKEKTKTFGPLTGAFHSAGMESICPITLAKNSRILPVFESSVWPVFSIAKSFQCRGVIDENKQCSFVTMSSVASLRGQQGMSIYSAAKAAIDGSIRSLAVELSSQNIRVNSIIAGAIKTEMHSRITKNLSEETLNTYEAKHLLGFGELGDIVNAAIFLLSSQSKWITGTSIVVDGGYLCK